jgi:stage III sporulation protein AC
VGIQFHCLGGKEQKPPMCGMEVSMDYFFILRIAAVGILVSILNQILKQSGRDELALLSTLAGWVLVLLWLIPHISELFLTIQKMFEIF